MLIDRDRMFVRGVIVTFMVLNGLISSRVSAASDSTDSRPFFARGSVVHGTYLEYFLSEDTDRNISVTQLNTEMAYFVMNRVSVMTNAYVMMATGQRFVDFQELDSERYGVGFAGFLRADVFDFRYHSLFADAGIGMVFTNKAFPPGGTKWNFTQRYGGGIAIRIEPDMRLMIGWRHMHISNGKGFGHPKNPAFDGNGLFAGLRFRF